MMERRTILQTPIPTLPTRSVPSPLPSSYHDAPKLADHTARSPTTPTVLEILENDRRYASPTYFLPHDDAEATRLAIQHQAHLLLLGGDLTLSRLPLAHASPASPPPADAPRPFRILDIGTGPGDWALAMAQALPAAEVVGTDLAPRPPADVPRNVTFVLEDAREPRWRAAAALGAPVDFVHVRGLAGAFARDEWPRVYRGAHACLAPEGALEVADWGLPRIVSRAARRARGSTKASRKKSNRASRPPSGSANGSAVAGESSGSTRAPRPASSSAATTTAVLTTADADAGARPPASAAPSASPNAPANGGADDAHLAVWTAALLAAAERAGTPLGHAHLEPRGALAAAGFAVQTARTVAVPLGLGDGPGPGGGDGPGGAALGKMALIAALEGLEARSLRLLTRELRWTAEGVRDLCEKVRGELLRAAAEGRAVVDCRVVVARKLMP